MKNIYVKITVDDPYHKVFEEIGKAATIEVAIKRALQKFRKEKWQRRPLKEVRIHAKQL